MKKRNPVSKSGANRLYKSTASKTHRKNLAPPPMRGGIRL